MIASGEDPVSLDSIQSDVPTEIGQVGLPVPPHRRKIVTFGPTTVNSFIRRSTEAEFLEIIQVTSETPLKIGRNTASDDDDTDEEDDGDRKWAVLAEGEVIVMEEKSTPHFNILDATLIMSKVAMTTSILNIPAAFYHGGGIVVALFTDLLIMLLSIPGLFILPRFAEDVQAPNDHDLYAAFGCLWHIFGSLVVTWTMMRSNIINLVLAGNQLEHAARELSGRPNYCTYWYFNRAFLIPIAAFLFAFPHIFHRGVCFFKYLSFIGMGCLSFVTAVVVIHYWIADDVDRGHIRVFPEKVQGAIFVLPIFVTSHMCHITAVPVYRMLNPKDREAQWKIIVGLTVGLTSILYATIGILGSLTFGSKVQSDLFNGYDFSKPIIFVAALGVLFANLLSYPIYLYCGRDAAMRLLFIAKGLLLGDNSYFYANSLARVHSKMRYIVSILYFLITILVACLVKPLNAFVSPNAAANSLFMFFFPGIVLLKGYGRGSWLRACGIILISVGLVVMLAVMSTTAYLRLVMAGIINRDIPGLKTKDLCNRNQTHFMFNTRRRNHASL